ncbi:hypothetical protein Y032_0064g3486 [Ancylostoma ceylanicum]|nr:hypothetical protein Y032_0064g3486 [Ancylostoma ceylanicum]
MPSMPIPSPQTYYCRIRNCQRTCGLLHRDSSRKKYAFGQRAASLDREEEKKETKKKGGSATTEKKKRLKKKAHSQRSILTNSSNSTTTESSGRESQTTKESPSPQPITTFEEIMERAARKVSVIKIDDQPISVPPPKSTNLSEKRLRKAPSVSLDTTTIHFDQPVWDNPKLREELLDSEEEFALDADPPSLREDSLVVDEIISEATHATDYNPIDHERSDEMISGWSSDENDYSNVDLTRTRQPVPPDSPDSVVMPLRKREGRKGVRYEQSLDLSEHV